jgi:hypothetical protein
MLIVGTAVTRYPGRRLPYGDPGELVSRTSGAPARRYATVPQAIVEVAVSSLTDRPA